MPISYNFCFPYIYLLRTLDMADLREDQQFLRDYPGACTISTQQVHVFTVRLDELLE